MKVKNIYLEVPLLFYILSGRVGDKEYIPRNMLCFGVYWFSCDINARAVRHVLVVRRFAREPTR